MTRRLVLTVLVAVALVVAGGSTRMSSAAFTATTSVPGNTITADRLSNNFLVTPGSAVRPGTSTPVASGGVDTLALHFGTAPSVHSFTNVFAVENVSGQPQTATLTSLGITQIASVFFASSGSSSATLAPGASTTVSVTSSPTALGLGTGTVRLGVSGSSWLYRNYADRALGRAPGSHVPGRRGATGRADRPRLVALHHSRDLGLRRLPLVGCRLYEAERCAGYRHDVLGQRDDERHRLHLPRAGSRGRTQKSLESATVGATADNVAPTLPTTVSLANGGGQGFVDVNLANRASVSVTVTLPASALSSDTVTVVVSQGAGSVTATVPGQTGAGNVTLTGLNTTALGDGAITLSATTADAAGNTRP